MKYCFEAKGRKLFQHRQDSTNVVLVFELESGEFINTATLKPFTPGGSYILAESHPDPAAYSWIGKYSDKWGDECVAFFESIEEADRYAADQQISNWVLQRVRVMGPKIFDLSKY